MSTYVAAVPVLYNAAFSGMIAGLQSQRKGTATTAGTYASYVAAATVFATAMDVAIAAASTPISTAVAKLAASSATIVSTTAAQMNAMASTPTALFGLCKSYFETSSLSGTASDTASASYSTAVTDITSLLAEMLNTTNGLSFA